MMEETRPLHHRQNVFEVRTSTLQHAHLTFLVSEYQTGEKSMVFTVVTVDEVELVVILAQF